MGTAGHASGAAYYYQVGVDIPESAWPHKVAMRPWEGAARIGVSLLKQRMGLALHPRYGGWFAFRFCLFFPGLQMDLQPRPPLDILAGPAEGGREARVGRQVESGEGRRDAWLGFRGPGAVQPPLGGLALPGRGAGGGGGGGEGAVLGRRPRLLRAPPRRPPRPHPLLALALVPCVRCSIVGFYWPKCDRLLE